MASKIKVNQQGVPLTPFVYDVMKEDYHFSGCFCCYME